MIERQKMNNSLTLAFSHLASHITMLSQQGMVDINKAVEMPLTMLLNKLYNLSLVNLNSLKHNHPAIDLGDDLTGVAVQVTSDGTRAKFDETITKYTTHGFDKKYKQVWFMVISTDAKISFTRKGYDILILTLSDLAKCICEKEDHDFNLIYGYCQREFSDYFHVNGSSPMAPYSTSSVDPSDKIDDFIAANGLEKDEYQTANADEVRNDIISLKDKLCSLSENQRWFLYHTINYTMNFSRIPEKCIIPVTVMKEAITDKLVLRDVYESLSALGLADHDECNIKLDAEVFEIRYKGKFVEEFDYFAGIADYLNNKGEPGMLKKIIVDCDFSVIH